MRRPLGAIFAPCSIALAGAIACTQLVDVDGDQCATDGDCAARGALFAGAVCADRVCSLPAAAPADAGTDVKIRGNGPFDCIGDNPYPLPTKPSIHFDLVLLDIFTNKGVDTLRVKVCPNVTDPDCSNPAQTLMTDSNGRVVFDVPTPTKAFDGYLDFDPVAVDGGPADTSGKSAATYIPARVYFSAFPLVNDYIDSFLLLNYGAADTFALLFSKKRDPGLGSAFLLSEDCQGHEAAGFSFGIDESGPSTLPFYLLNGTPSTTGTQTDNGGTGGFVNVEVGGRTFTTTQVGTRTQIGTVNVYIRPGTIVYAKIGPTYTQ